MSKQTTASKREGAPVPAPVVPWGQADAGEVTMRPDFAPPPKSNPESDVAAMLAALDQNAQETSGIDVPMAEGNPFVPKISTNPFKAPPAKPEAEVVEYEVREDQPMWLEFVRFVQKYGDKIIQARYPKPMGTIDTIWRGVQVFPHEEVMVRHITEGWVTWEVANAP